MKITLAHNLPANPPNCNAGRFLFGPTSASLENTHPLPGFEYSGRWSRPFQPVFPASVFGVPATRRCSCRIVNVADNSLACAQALGNAGENRLAQTRGFTSWWRFPNFAETKSSVVGLAQIKAEGMSQKVTIQRLGAKTVLPTTSAKRGLEVMRQITHRCSQRMGDLHQRIHRRGFFSTFNTADEDGRKVCFFGQLFLGETGTFAFGANGFTEETAVWWAGQHEPLIDGKRADNSMSLTPSFYSCLRIRHRQNMCAIDLLTE